MRDWIRGAMAPLAAGAAAVFIAACGGSAEGGGRATPSPVDVGSGTLSGAGSTFVQPFFQKAFFEYNAKYPAVVVNYQGVGSGAGIQQFTAGTVDFGATDVPMAASDISAAGGASSLIQIPDALGAVSIAYNLSGVGKLRLDGPALADIFLGKLKRWNDPKIAAQNPGVSLPGTNITTVHRSDSSGTTYIVTDYLSKVSPAWASGPGKGKSVSWPAGIGQKGTAAVAGAISQTDGAIGYVELAYVVQTGMRQAYLKNEAGKYLPASVGGATAAAAHAGAPSAASFSIVDEPGETSYPITGYSWALIRTSIPDLQKARALVYLFDWLVTKGQQYGTALEYAALPPEAQSYAVGLLKTVRSGSTPVSG